MTNAPSFPTHTPFHRVLVANRGEIAARVMRTARRLGLQTVAVYSDADHDAPHVHAADSAVCIGAAAPRESYLNIAAIVDAARRSGADAVHPGYGFLSENHAFAQACIDAGLVWVGPSPAAILAMGDKAEAKQRMVQAGVPCIPGYQGDDGNDAVLQAEADRIGYPVMIKAVAGGGGRGMRLVSSPDQFAEQLQRARAEAAHAFGDHRVLLERAIVAPRHIEIQVVGDRHGHAIHLGERDCSVQRRHQKVIEEAPSPAVNAELRERMGAVAVRAAQAIGYEGVGTLEFLLDEAGEFYFMEMNTRLQVEHPVTEAVTGLDLVELQLRVAAGEPLPLAQSDVRWQGHAIEVRLCAESPEQGFMPQTGELGAWLPAPALRADHALRPGYVVAPHYDSMVAKLIAHGSTRDAARRQLMQGLDDTVALGVATNQVFLRRCLANPVFARGGATTAFVADQADALVAPGPVVDDGLRLAAAWLRRQPAGGLAHGFTVPLRLRPLAPVPSDPVLVQLRHTNGQSQVQIAGGAAVGIRLAMTEPPDASRGGMTAVEYLQDGVRRRAHVWQRGGVLWLQWLGASGVQVAAFQDVTHEAAVAQQDAASDGVVRAALSGRVVAVKVQPGDVVQAKQPLVVLEAMKMEHVHLAPLAGRVARVDAVVGEQVPAQRVLVQIQTEGAA